MTSVPPTAPEPATAAASAEAPTSSGSGVALDHAVVRGGLWLVAAGLIGRVMTVIGTVKITHLIAPAEYGEVSVAVVVAFTTHALANVGTGTYVIANPDAPPEDLFLGAFLHVAIGAVLFGAMLALGRPLGAAFGAPAMSRYLPGLAFALMCERVGLVPERLLVRQMRFRASSLQRAVAEMLYTVVSVGTALAGMGGMAIVAGNVARSGGRLPIVFSLVGWREWLRPVRLRWPAIRRFVRFGAPISLGQIVSFAIRRWDNLVVSRLHGTAAVGAYNLAYNLADIPAVQIGEQVTEALQVGFTKDRANEPRQQLLQSLSVLAFVMTPLAVGLGTLAPTLTSVFLDRRWAEVGPMLMWLSVISFPRPLSGVVGAYMQVRQRRRAFLAMELFTLVTLLGSLLTLGRLSPIAACIAVGLTFILRLVATGVLLWKLDNVPLLSFFRPQVPPLAAAFVMAAAVTAVRLGLRHAGVPGALSLVAQFATGVVAYAVAAWIIAPKSSREFLSLIRQVRHREK